MDRWDRRWAGGDINRIQALAHELVGLHPDIILASSTSATVAVQRETRAIPIVFVDRSEGVSKMHTGIVREAALMVWKMRFLSLMKRL